MINIFILNWNSASDVKKLLNSLENSTYKLFRVLLIHNATSDELQIKTLFEKYQNIFDMHLIINKENKGYAGGNNSGYNYLLKRELKGDILILNPDVVLQPDALDALISAKKPNVGAVMIRTFDETGRHLYDFVKLKGFKQSFHISTKHVVESDYAAGSCLLLDRGVIDKIGLFDERYFMYWEEVDLSLRIKEVNKIIISTTHSYIIRKKNPASRSNNAIFYSTKNALLIYLKFKNFSFFSLFVFYVYMSLYSIKVSLTSASTKPFTSFLKGMLRFKEQ